MAEVDDLEGMSSEVPLGEKLAYGLGFLGYFVTSASISMWGMKYYEDVLGVRAELIATAYLIYAVWNALNDPIFGYLEDRIVTSWGRRRPYLIFGSPFLALFYILFWIPLFSGEVQALLYLVLMLCAYDTFYTLIGLAYYSLLPELTLDPVERSKLSAFSFAFGIPALALGWILPVFFYRSPERMILLAASLGLLAFATPFITGLFVRERYRVERFTMGLRESVAESFKSKSFLIFEGYFFLFTLAQYVFIPNFPYFVEYVLGLEKTMAALLLLVLFISAAAAFPMVIVLQKKMGTKRSLMLVLAFLIASLTSYLVVDSFVEAVLAVVLTGIGFSAPSLFFSVMLGDIVDEDALKTGVRREGMFFGVNALITKPAISLGVFIIGLVHQMTGYSAESLTTNALLGIRLLASVIPAAILVGGLAFLAAYPLHGEYLRRIKEEVRKRGLGGG